MVRLPSRPWVERYGPRGNASRRGLQTTLVVLGGVAATTGLASMARGTAIVRGAPPAHPNVESEHRFYAASWAALGVTLWTVAPRVERRGVALAGAGATVFAGGVARLAAIRETGSPDPLYRVLTAVELALPPALLVWQAAVRRAAR